MIGNRPFEQVRIFGFNPRDRFIGVGGDTAAVRRPDRPNRITIDAPNLDVERHGSPSPAGSLIAAELC